MPACHRFLLSLFLLCAPLTFAQTPLKTIVKGKHSTEWNQTADALVKNDPQRYEYVDTPKFWKGVDY